MTQREVPANIAQEYCRTDLALSKERSFTELEFPRTLAFDNWLKDKTESWFPLHLDNKLGCDFGIYYCMWRGVARRAMVLAGAGYTHASRLNLAGLLTLCEVRSEQVIELGGRLSRQAQQEIDLEVVQDSCMSYS